MNFTKTIINAIKCWVDSRLQSKVDVINGKGLSTNDYTDAEKEKLASLDATIADSLDELQTTLDTTIAGIQNDLDTHTHSLDELQTTLDTTIAGIQNDLDTHTHSWNDLNDRPFGEISDTRIVTVLARQQSRLPFPANIEFTASCNGTTKTFNTSNLSTPKSVGQLSIVYSYGMLVLINNNPQASNNVTLSYDMVQQLDEKYIPDTIARLTDIPVTSVNGKTGTVSLTAADVGATTASYVDTKIAELVDSSPDTLNTLNELAAALGDDPNFATTIATEIGTLSKQISAPKDSIIFKDQVNGYEYIVCMREGNIVSYIATKLIEITNMPIKTEYTAGEYFDPTGMIVTAIAFDDTTKEITNYTYSSNYLTEDITSVEISYIEGGVKHIASIPVTVNGDG